MEISGINGQKYHENVSGTKAKQGKRGNFYENLSENLNGQSGENAGVAAASSTVVNTPAGVAAEMAANRAYQHQNIPSAPETQSKEKTRESSDDTELDTEKALLEFYEFIEDRIKNGPPKYMIGNTEFSVEEWDKFMEGVDGQIDDIKEETRSRIAKLEEMALYKQIKEITSGVPYAHLAKDGIIEYNGVTFVCDEKHRAIRLGDTSNSKECLNIPLSGGGSLIVNRDNLDDLAAAIGMFSPEDVNLIMRAIAKDAKIQQMKNEIEDETSGEKITGANETGEEDEAEE